MGWEALPQHRVAPPRSNALKNAAPGGLSCGHLFTRASVNMVCDTAPHDHTRRTTVAREHSQNGPQHTHTLLTLSRLQLENQVSASDLELRFDPVWHTRPKLGCVQCPAVSSSPSPVGTSRLSAAPPPPAARPSLRQSEQAKQKKEKRARDRRLARRPRDRPRDRSRGRAEITTSSCAVTRSKAGSLCGRRRRGCRWSLPAAAATRREIVGDEARSGADEGRMRAA